MIVRKATKQDIGDIVIVHLERFPSFFLTSLGNSFLKVFYAAFLKSPGILLVLVEDDEIRGFAAGSRNNRSFFKKLLRNNFFGFILAGLRLLITNPSTLKRLAQNVGRAEKNNLIFAELLSIATLRNKKAYGRTLLEEFEKEVIRKNIHNLPISLTTDYENNAKAIQFYIECGYTVHEVFKSYHDRKMYRFMKNLK